MNNTKMSEDLKNDKTLKVFFIVSIHSCPDNIEKFTLEKTTEKYSDLKILLQKSINNNNTALICYFSFLKESEKNKDTNRFEDKIKLEFKNNIFYGSIFFDKTKNNFIYDFKFEDTKEYNNTISPQNHINLSTFQQLKLYSELMKQYKIKMMDSLFTDLINDSLYYLEIKIKDKDSYYYFDYYLELFKMCYASKEIRRLLVLFNLSKVKLPDNLIINDYSKILNSIESNPKIITKHCIKKQNENSYIFNAGDNELNTINIYLKIFYRLLLYFKSNYQKEEVYNLLNKKDLWEYFINIIKNDYSFFSNINAPEELINEIFKKKDLSYQLTEKEGFEKNIIQNIKSLSKSLNLNCQFTLNKKNIIEKRLVMPVIGNISNGKTSLINAFMGKDICPVKNDITTTSALFIRHINNLNEPRLYKLSPIKNLNNNFYDFERSNEIIIGEINIKDKIEEINKFSKISIEPIFYMLEIEIKSIKNKEFLNKVDFLDIPGLNESNKNYIELYFKYIKDMIKYGIIIFSTENYYSKDSIEVIKIVKNNIFIPIKNFLLILNKIDKTNGEIDKTIYNFKKIILNHYNFNCYENTIVPLNSLKLKSEILKENDFYHYLNYYFFEFINIKNNKKTFIDFIQNKIINLNENQKELISNEFKNFQFNDNILEKAKKDLNNFVEEKKNKGYNNIIIDTNDQKDFSIIKYFYVCFKKNVKFHEDSNSIKEINNYFDQIKDHSFPKQESNEINEKDKLIYDESKEHEILKRLNDFYQNKFNSSKLKKYGVIVDLLNKDLEILKNYLLNSNLLFIPVLGISNSGKSSFINCLLKKEILTVNLSECTRRGIIIKNIKEKDKSYIYSIKFKFQENNSFNKYYYYTKERLLSNNIEEIKEIIQILNEDYPPKEEDSFLLLETNIPVLDDLNLESDIKNKICFIDFPGHNTQNNLFFEKKIYHQVLKMSSFFIYMNNGKAFKEDSNKSLLSTLFEEVINIRIGDITPEQFIDSCLFIFNKSDCLDENEKNLEGIEEEIKEIIGIKDNKIKIFCSLFSSLNYNNYRKEVNKFKIENFENILEDYYSKYKDQLNNQNNFINFEIEKDFLNYLYKNLSKSINYYFKELTPIKYNNEETTKSLKNIIEDFYTKNNLEKSKNFEDNILNISNLLNYLKNNKEKIFYYKESYALETFILIKSNIIKSYNLKKYEFINHLERIFYFMNIFFRIENSYINNDANSDFKKALNEELKNIEEIINDFKPEDYFKAYKQDIFNFIDERKNCFKELVKENKNVLDFINKQIILKIKNLKEELDKNYDLVQEKISEKLKKLGIPINEILNNNKKNDLFKKKINYTSIIISFPFLLVYGITCKLPSLIAKKIIQNFKSQEIIFKEKLEKIKNKIDTKFNEILIRYNKEIIKIKKNIIKIKEKILGLIEASSVEIDEFWEEAKKEYIKIKEKYENIKKW